LGLKFTAAGKTDIGLVRSGNEDSFRIIDDSNLFIVADGMGGHQAGEVASKEACDIIDLCFTQMADEILADDVLAIPAKFPKVGELMVKSIRIANRSIYRKSVNDASLAGMGTTIVAAVIDGNMINIAHAGDSRAYRLTGDKLVQLTSDHSWVAELQKNGMYTEAEANQMAGKNVITRALGVHDAVDIDYRCDKLTEGETYIFCTDGLCGFAEDEIIYSVASQCGGDVQKICDNLVNLANDRGGQDNVTVVAVRIDKIDEDPICDIIRPVTVAREADETIERENELVAKIDESKAQIAEVLSHTENKTGVVPFIFVIVAIIIILVLVYLSVFK
jgi:protein phosphatase